MAGNKKSCYNILYSIKVGSSTYNILDYPKKNSNRNAAFFLPEQATTRSKSANPLTKSTVRIQRSQSLRRTVSPERRSKTSHPYAVTFDSDLISRKEPQTRHHHHRRYVQSKSKNTKRITEKMTKSKRDVLLDSFHLETLEKKSGSVRSIQNEEKESVKDIINNQNHEITRLFGEQKCSLIQLLEEQFGTMTLPSIENIKRMLLETLQSQQQIFTRELERSLTQTVQQELQKHLPEKDDKRQSNRLDTATSNQLQDIVTKTIGKCITLTIKDNNSTLSHLFAEQKQVLLETLTQQQSITSIDLVKQALIDALNEYNSSSVITSTTTNTAKPLQRNNEIQTTADVHQTRTDAAFRQQRDSIVANRYLRDSVRQWSNVRSVSSLIENIQECSTNDMENAWLLYCWMGQNIRYDLNCPNNSAEYVFQNRKGSSHGFVHFYQECCSQLNIQCLQIEGYTRQNEFFEQSSHVWNGIILDQYTYLIDATWGAGGVDNTKEFEDFYFLTSPEEFIYTHYSKDYQLLQPTITKEDFLNLPMMKSNYYRLNLNLVSPKQAFNQTNENLFKISLKTPAYVDVIAALQVNRMEYPSHLHTLCQRDLLQTDVMNCFFALPTNGPYEIIVYAKTHDEVKYQETISMRLNVSNMRPSITFPMRSQAFLKYQCILIEPFRRLVQENERICISLRIPDALVIKIRNGDEFILPSTDEYKDSLLKKELVVRGDIRVCVRWNEKAEKLSTICVFHML